LTDKGLRAVSSLASLSYLNLSWCDQVTGAGLRAVSNLTALNFTGCRNLTGAGLRALSNLTALNLSSCRKVSDEELRALSSLTALTTLDVYGCPVSVVAKQALRTAILNLTIVGQW
jgi:Leucine-rich repeat (LRR) protein